MHKIKLELYSSKMHTNACGYADILNLTDLQGHGQDWGHFYPKLYSRVFYNNSVTTSVKDSTDLDMILWRWPLTTTHTQDHLCTKRGGCNYVETTKRENNKIVIISCFCYVFAK